MQQAFGVLTGNRVFGLGEIEDDGAVLDDYCIASAAQETLQGTDERFGIHSRILARLRSGVCDY
jgi:hypothetical protein